VHDGQVRLLGVANLQSTAALSATTAAALTQLDTIDRTPIRQEAPMWL
jgi:hypothetical protein